MDSKNTPESQSAQLAWLTERGLEFMARPLSFPMIRPKFRASATATKVVDIYDALRRRWVALTPEEWVRQHVVSHLIGNLGYPALRVANEVSLRLNGMSRRADTVVYDNMLRPVMVVECKASDVPLDGKVMEQALRYNLVLGVPVLVITNGIRTFAMSTERGKLLDGIPTYAELIELAKKRD